MCCLFYSIGLFHVCLYTNTTLLWFMKVFSKIWNQKVKVSQLCSYSKLFWLFRISLWLHMNFRIFSSYFDLVVSPIFFFFKETVQDQFLNPLFNHYFLNIDLLIHSQELSLFLTFLQFDHIPSPHFRKHSFSGTYSAHPPTDHHYLWI